MGWLSDHEPQPPYEPSFYERLHTIGDEFRDERAAIHERALIKVLDAIIATPDSIGRTYWRTRTTDDWQFHTLTCLFADADISNYEWMGSRQMPPDAIRFTYRDEVLIKVETRFDSSFDTYNMRFFGDCELKDKCGRVIALVASVRVMPW